MFKKRQNFSAKPKQIPITKKNPVKIEEQKLPEIKTSIPENPLPSNSNLNKDNDNMNTDNNFMNTDSDNPIDGLPEGNNDLNFDNFYTSNDFFKKPFSAKIPRNGIYNKTNLEDEIERKSPTRKNWLISSIPKTLIDRLKLFCSIFKSDNFVSYYSKCPSKLSTSLEKIRKYLFKFSDHHNELDKYAMFFYYLCHQIKYDVKGVNRDVKDLQEIFKSGLANNFQFEKLFSYMCKKSKMKVRKISGFCKDMILPYFKPGMDISVFNHCWNAINIQNEWYFVDVTFGSGGIRPRSEYFQEYFNPYYFLTPPEYLAYSHKPLEELWEFTNKQIQDKEFAMRKNLYLGAFYQKVYEHEIILYSHDFPIIHSNTRNVIIKIGIQNELIQAFLFLPNLKTKLSEVKFSFNDKTNVCGLEPTLPGNGEYILQVLSRSINSTDLVYVPLFNYKIIIEESEAQIIKKLNNNKLILPDKPIIPKKSVSVAKKGMNKTTEGFFKVKQPRIVTNYDSILPCKTRKVICMDNEGAYLFEPRSHTIKIGYESYIKCRVKDAIAVCVLDGKKMIFLKKKDENIYEGNVTVQNENIVICCLKPTNVYTEVFLLKGIQTNSKMLKNLLKKNNK